MVTSTEKRVALEYQGALAIITLNNAEKLNALDGDLYYRLGDCLREVAERKDVYVTLLIGTGRYFSAGADVAAHRGVSDGPDARRSWLRSFLAHNMDLTRAFYAHPKILVTGMNGPAVGLSAALSAFSDFIYATPDAFILTPFTSLGLVAEGGSSHAFAQRLGIARANEALIMSKRIPAEELLQAGFVNRIFDTGGDEARFRDKVIGEIQNRLLSDHLHPDSLLKTKALIRQPDRAILDRQNMEEVFEGLERFTTGTPGKELDKIAKREKKHKL